MPTLVLAALTLLLAGCLTPAVKVDLTAHLAPVSAVGDFKVFAVDDGTERRIETVRVEPYAEGRYEAVTYSVAGRQIGGSAGVVLPGRDGAILTTSLSGGLEISWESPGLVRSLSIPPGRTLKARADGPALLNGVRMGSATVWSAATLLGFDLCETPAASYPDSARFEESQTLRVRDKVNHRKIEIRVEGTACYAAGRGLVASTERRRTYVDGSLREDTGDVHTHLVSGTILGVPIP